MVSVTHLLHPVQGRLQEGQDAVGRGLPGAVGLFPVPRRIRGPRVRVPAPVAPGGVRDLVPPILDLGVGQVLEPDLGEGILEDVAIGHRVGLPRGLLLLLQPGEVGQHGVPDGGRAGQGPPEGRLRGVHLGLPDLGLGPGHLEVQDAAAIGLVLVVGKTKGHLVAIRGPLATLDALDHPRAFRGSLAIAQGEAPPERQPVDGGTAGQGTPALRAGQVSFGYAHFHGGPPFVSQCTCHKSIGRTDRHASVENKKVKTNMATFSWDPLGFESLQYYS